MRLFFITLILLVMVVVSFGGCSTLQNPKPEDDLYQLKDEQTITVPGNYPGTGDEQYYDKDVEVPSDLEATTDPTPPPVYRPPEPVMTDEMVKEAMKHYVPPFDEEKPEPKVRRRKWKSMYLKRTCRVRASPSAKSKIVLVQRSGVHLKVSPENKRWLKTQSGYFINEECFR